MKIVDALSSSAALLSEYIAKDIELNLFLFCEEKLSRQYRSRARSLLSNLKSNEALRGRIIDGSLPCRDLVRMNSSSLATKDLTNQREQWLQEKKIAAQEPRIPQLPRARSMFSCKNCGEPSCEIFHVRKAGSLADRIHTILRCVKCQSYSDQ